MAKFFLVGLLVLATGASLYFVLERTGASTNAACEHGLESGRCPFCDPGRVAELGVCAEHGVPEALCTRCDRSLIPAFQATGDWCAEHGLPESQCLACRGGVTPPDPGSAFELVDLSEGPRHRRAPLADCDKERRLVQLRSPRTAADVGLEVERIERRAVAEKVVCNAELAFDGNHYAHLASRAPGIVLSVLKDVGESVEAGEVLAVVDSAELGSAAAEYKRAKALVALWEKNHARELSLFEGKVTSERSVLESETHLVESRIALSAARQRLRNLGLAAEAIEGLDDDDDQDSLLPLTAPFDGTLVARDAVVGEVVDLERPLFAIANTQRMWALLDVYERDIARVEPGQLVALEVDALPGVRFTGRITWVSSEIDHKTRTLQARAELDNPESRLRAGMFARAQVALGADESALVVPKSAVQWEGCCNVVFVRDSDVLYEPRKVKLGFATDDRYVVEEGVDEGEMVVTTGSFLLKTEILSGSIGAGCCEAGPRGE